MQRLFSKTALITGCNRGIGKATVEVFAAEGANIICAIRKENPEFKQFTDSLSEKYGVSIEHRYFDLSDEDSIKALVKGLIQEKRRIDILVNNAGMPDDFHSENQRGLPSELFLTGVFDTAHSKDDDETEIWLHYQHEQCHSTR